MKENLLHIKEAKACEHGNKWELAIQEEIKALHSNDTWDLVKLPKGRKAIPNKWVHKITTVDDKLKYKARLVANGYAQTKGIDFQEGSFFSYGKNDHFGSAICYSGCT